MDWSLHVQLKVRKARCYLAPANFSMPSVARFPIIQEKPEKSQVLNAGNYFKFLKNTMKVNTVQTKQIQPTICQLQTLLGLLIFNISIQNKSLFQLFPLLLSTQLVHLSKSLFVLLLTF